MVFVSLKEVLMKSGDSWFAYIEAFESNLWVGMAIMYLIFILMACLLKSFPTKSKTPFTFSESILSIWGAYCIQGNFFKPEFN